MTAATRVTGPLGIATVSLLCALAPCAIAQSPDRAVEFEDYGLDRPLDASTRGVGLSAFAATANDASALAYNPAGLARIKRVTGVASMVGIHTSFDFQYDGSVRTSDVDEVALQFAGAAFPLPVLRGSLVPAIGVQRLYTASLDISYQGFNAPDVRNDRLAINQSGAAYAYHVGAAIDLSSFFALGASVMFLDGGVDRIRQYDTRRLVIDPNVHTFVYEDATADIDGYAGRFGLMFYVIEQLQVSVAYTTPTAFETEVTTVSEVTRQVDNDVGSFERTTTTTTTDYKTPYYLEGALAMPLARSLLLTAQVGYADWSQATIDEQRLITTTHQSVMRSVVDIRAGAEWSASRWPLRVRAGFALARRAVGFLEADRIDYDRLQPIASESSSARYSVGAGYLLGRAIAIDLAVGYARGERVSTTIGDTRHATSVSIGCGYWF